MIFVGGFTGTGAVGLWGLMAPMGALVFGDVRSGIRWFIAFLAVFVVCGVVGGAVAPAGPRCRDGSRPPCSC